MIKEPVPAMSIEKKESAPPPHKLAKFLLEISSIIQRIQQKKFYILSFSHNATKARDPAGAEGIGRMSEI